MKCGISMPMYRVRVRQMLYSYRQDKAGGYNREWTDTIDSVRAFLRKELPAYERVLSGAFGLDEPLNHNHYRRGIMIDNCQRENIGQATYYNWIQECVDCVMMLAYRRGVMLLPFEGDSYDV